MVTYALLTRTLRAQTFLKDIAICYTRKGHLIDFVSFDELQPVETLDYQGALLHVGLNLDLGTGYGI